MKTKHTPGPWKVRNQRDVTLSYLDGRVQKGGIEIDILSDPDNAHIVTISKSDSVRQRALANAQLIAAAPDLLKALQELMLLSVTTFRQVEDHPIYKQATDAIKKANL